ncbi:pyridine nucleotide-disulfide oxidoreductase, partial [bacterium]|nr:pyridine nucleotide-disulfide oxidoreductase [bacterium]
MAHSERLEDFALGVPGYRFSHLYQPARLKGLYEEFWRQAEAAEPGLRARFEAAHAPGISEPQKSQALIDVAHRYGEFVARLFHITADVARIRNQTLALDPIFRFKNEFLKTRVFKRFTDPPMGEAEFIAVDKLVQGMRAQEPEDSRGDDEARFAKAVLFLLDCSKKIKKELLSPVEQSRAQSFCSPLAGSHLEGKIQEALKLFEDWCVHVHTDPKRLSYIDGWVSYHRPEKVEFENLVPTDPGPLGIPEHRVKNTHLRPRDGFKLTDRRMGQKQILREIDYCLYCHQREKDSCSKGFVEKEGGFKKNPLGIALQGCPLDERISEMHWLRKKGEPLAALAMVILDNPLCPGTGHRICNECMKACIFQKQEPVNIPENETAVLVEVLNLPYGVEIYGLMTRLNPLNRQRPYALPYHGNDVLVVGLGPAGYTLSHYLSNEGFGVVGIDGLKIEPFSDELTGKGKSFPKPIKQYSDLTRELDERVLRGFGGVSEYGITVRWDKNFLGLIYLTLLRRHNTRFYGGVRFGGTLTLDDAWDLGFKHVALATGAGRPTLVTMKNNLSR